MKFLKNYKWGIDYLAALLFALLILPNIVYWCIPEFAGLDGNRVTAVISYILEFLGGGCMIAILHKEQKTFSYFTLTGTLTWLFLLLSYVAWIFYFCGFANIAVALFLAVCPGVALLAFQFARQNYIAAAPTALYVLLHFIGVLVVWI